MEKFQIVTLICTIHYDTLFFWYKLWPVVHKTETFRYSGQEGFQKFLVFIALMCVPWMLCGKPYLIWKERKLELLKVITRTLHNIKD